MPSPLRLLLADDNLPDRLLAEAAFEALEDEVEVTYCQNGREVLRTLLAPGTAKPDVVVLDLNMPVMDGHETLEALRRHPALCHYPVAILTSSRERRDITQAYDERASLYMVKALDFPTFTEQMRTFVAFYRQCRFPPAHAPPSGGA